jgi:L-lactate dehydrogenase complex protein LldG
MSSRDQILNTLRAVRQPFTDLPPVETRRPMVPVADTSPAGLLDLFTREAEALRCQVAAFDDPGAAARHIINLIGDDRSVLSWDLAHVPLPGLGEVLAGAGIRIALPSDPSVRVGITGAEAALAGTGGLVLASGTGKSRQPSLLPEVHICVITLDQIVPNFEAWMASQRAAGLDQFRSASCVVLISGPSRTADIANELVMGVHGPGAVHVVVLR